MERLGSEEEIDSPFKEALNKVVPAMVVLRTTACRAFDTQSAGASSATGFVVDKSRGIILTNRHVVKPGPVVAEAMFVNREEIPVQPIYRDPVHDFGFFLYDPCAIQFLSYEEIPLAPEAACVGLEIRMVGNDSGDKVSILAGTLARLDRDAPHYRKDGYNDFNTFYIQAASGAKGGSSGSPVIDRQGRAVALHAGGRASGASAFFLPLERVVRALGFLQRGRCTWIPRGTLQATFLHKGFDETRRLGLGSETEELVRLASPPGETGMLVVDSVVPGGPAHKHLEPGDVLIRLNGEVSTRFLKMETLLDDNVNNKIELEIERGGEALSVELRVEDLHSITPDYFLEVSGAIIHPLSYQQARNFSFQCGLVYVANAGYMLSRAGVPRYAIINKFAGQDITKLDDFISVLSKFSRGARVPLEYITHTDRHQGKSVLVTIDRHEWYAPPHIYTRNDTTGLWTMKPVLLSCSAEMEHALEESMEKMRVEDDESRDFQVAERVIEPSLVMLEVRVPPSCMLDGVHSGHFIGTGLIIHHSQTKGLVVVDRNTVVVSVSDVMLSFAAYPIEIPGEIVFLHPVHNFALVAYDPCALGPGASLVRAAQLLPEPALGRGDSVCLVGLNESLQTTCRKSFVTNACAALNIGSATAPRYRATNMEVIELDTDFGCAFSGVLTDDLGRVQAIWGSFSTQCSGKSHEFSRGIPIYTISHTLDKIVSAPARLIMPLVKILEVELYPTLLSKARSFGLSDSWIRALMKKDPLRRQVLRVKGCLAGSKAENLLQQGDMVLAINKEAVTCFRDIEDACQELDELKVTIFRQGREIDVVVGIDVRDGNGTRRVINWCGCAIQEPHSAVRALGFLPQEGHGVYVARWWQGSPGHRYNLYCLVWIVQVNGKPTPNLDAFVAVIKEIEHGEFVRVRTVNFKGTSQVLTLKQDLHYWPTWELHFDPETGMWHRATIKMLHCSNAL
ncbi:protease Do-like 7 [Salvia miltiorrhiza]|uniref:protease Do-like 7 n=1 Tax=Salvia miltiorrhiza TaxID=226208 RepID=UPI0025ABF79C|nr:protease Do-like 7 [Salvia miltiorrhiza]XP_057796552.1 protease Do-like 7 [Salvia miltiorrhiza]